MTKLYAGIVILILCAASCTPFERMHYRHINKIPATPQAYTSCTNNVNASPGQITVNGQQEVAVAIPDSTLWGFVEAPPTPAVTGTKDSSAVKDSTVIRDSARPMIVRTREMLLAPASLPHDYSLLIASFMILLGIMLILYGIYVVPYLGIALLLRIALELLIGVAAVKLLISGFAIFRNRFREKKTYKETQ